MDASHKKTIIIAISSVLGFIVLFVLIAILYFNSQFDVYQDAQYKFSIKYPKNWKVIIHPRANVAVVFLRPKDTALDTLQENFNVTVQPVPDVAYTLPAFTDTVKKQMTLVFGKSINFVEDKSIALGWREGHQIAIEAPKPDHLKMVNAWVLRSNQVYIMTFLGDIGKYAQDGLLVNEMIRSIQLQ